MFKLKHHKALNYNVAFFTTLLTLLSNVNLGLSLSLQNTIEVSGKPTAKSQTKEQLQKEAIDLTKQGFNLLQRSQYKQALELFEKALVIFRQIDDKIFIGVALNNIGEVYRNWGQYQKALDYYLQALTIVQQVNDKNIEAKVINNIATVYGRLGESQKALDFYQKSLVLYRQAGDKAGESSSLNNIGFLYQQLGEYQKALDYYQQVLNLVEKIKDKSIIPTTVNNIAMVYENMGRFQMALSLYQRLLDLYKKNNDKASEGQTLNNIASVYYKLGQYKQALEYLQQALLYRQQLGDKPGESSILSNMGVMYLLLRQHQTALKYHQNSLEITQKIGDKGGQGITLNNIGTVYMDLGEYQKALGYFQQSLAFRKQVGDKAGESKTLANIGETHNKLKQYAQALEFFQQSLTITKKIGDKPTEGIILNNMGISYIGQRQYARAETPLFAAIAIWDSLRTTLTDEQKISIFSQQAFTYLWLQQTLVAQNKIEQALEISERGRARAFVDLLASKASNNNAVAKLPRIASIKEVARKQKSTLVEYSVAWDILNIWIVKPTGEIAFERVNLNSLRTPLNKLVENSRLSIGVRGRGLQVTSTSKTNNTERLQELHNLLIKPIAKHLPKKPDERVVFIPHESLFLVPFPALMDENNKYLIEKHTILTAPAIQVLEFTEKNNQKPINFASLKVDEKLIVGNPTMPFVGIPAKQLSNLPGAEVEAKLIASLLNAKPLIGSSATKSAVMSRLNNAKIIHLATHGLLDGFGERTPGAIALAPDANRVANQPNEGLLRTREIVENLKLQADLVVLSACDTGKGEISGDGVQGLSRALLTAGAKSLIVSLWQVPDKATSDLMIEFYQQLDKNPDKAYSLRQAMLKTIKKYPDVVNWAAFTIIGNPE